MPLYISDWGTEELATRAALAPYCRESKPCSQSYEFVVMAVVVEAERWHHHTHMAHYGYVILRWLRVLHRIVSPRTRIIGVHCRHRLVLLFFFFFYSRYQVPGCCDAAVVWVWRSCC